MTTGICLRVCDDGKLRRYDAAAKEWSPIGQGEANALLGALEQLALSTGRAPLPTGDPVADSFVAFAKVMRRRFDAARDEGDAVFGSDPGTLLQDVMAECEDLAMTAMVAWHRLSVAYQAVDWAEEARPAPVDVADLTGGPKV